MLEAQFAESPLLSELVDGAIGFANGLARVLRASGLGFSLNRAKIEKLEAADISG